MEPRAPAPARRLQMIRRLAEAGIPVRIQVSPLIPALTDHELEAVMEAGRDAGATYANSIPLRLPLEVADLFRTGWRPPSPTAPPASWAGCANCTAGATMTRSSAPG